MARIYINELSQHVGEEVQLFGWVYNKRSSGKVKFLILRDGTGIAQAVIVKGQLPDEVINVFESLTQESSLSIRGKVRKEDRAPGGYELDLIDIPGIKIRQVYP